MVRSHEQTIITVVVVSYVVNACGACNTTGKYPTKLISY